MPALRDSIEPIASSATHAPTVVEPGLPASLREPLIVPRSSAPIFRGDLESELSRRDSIDFHQRRKLWWVACVIPLLGAVMAVAIQMLGGDPVVKRLLIAALIAGSGTGMWMGWMARTRRTWVGAATISWFILAVEICCATLYFGAFSPALMVAAFAVFFVGTRDELVVALTAYLTIAVFHLALVVALVAGGLHDPGVFTVVETDAGKLVILEVLVQGILLATLTAACAVRRSMVRTVRDLELQARTLGHHELLLEDAKRAFEASLRAAGGGRFSHQILGSYRLGRLLGEGAMGEVYDAVDTRSGGAAAVKLLRREVIEDRRVVQRFLTEARIVTSLQTDHIARVLETGDPTSGLPYIAMERLHGHDLRQHLKDRADGRLPLAEVDELLRQVARGIDAAHRADIVHRDLKPSNLFREDSGTWKILDFGVSKVTGEGTTEHALVGTPNFMAPEQVNGGAVDARTDIFALGAIVYRALTGKLAFGGDNLAAIAIEVTRHAPPPPSELVAGLPAGVDAAVMTALAKEPDHRFATATAFAETFSRAAGPTPSA
jgi:serine/threonine-protein kinase